MTNKIKFYFTNINEIDKNIKNKILKLTDLTNGKTFSHRYIIKKVNLLAKIFNNLYFSYLSFNKKFYLAILPKKRIIKPQKKQARYNSPHLIKAKEYWKKIEKYSDMCCRNKKIPSLSIRNGYLSYGKNQFKCYEKYFLNLKIKDYIKLKKIVLYDKNINNRFYAMLAIHHWDNKKEVLKTFARLINYPNPWDANNAGFFMFPLSKRIKIPEKIIWTLINAEHQAPISKGLYILNKNIEHYKINNKHYTKLKLLSKWKTDTIKYYAQNIIKKL